MSGEPGAASGRAAELRRAFDQGFAEPPPSARERATSFLGIRVSGQPYAIRLDEIAGLFANRKVVSLLSSRPDFLGLAGLRGDIVPVYSLAGLLGHAVAGDPPRWLVLAGAGHALGMAFDEFDGYLRVLPSEILPSRGASARAHLPEAVRAADVRRGVVSIPSIVSVLEQRSGVDSPKEQ